MKEFFARFINLIRRPIVIVEIGNDWFKSLVARVLPKGIHIEKIALQKFAHIDSLHQGLEDMLKTLKVPPHSCIFLCIPRHLLTLKVLDFPSTNPEEIKKMVEIQASKQTPYSKEEIIVGYRIIGEEQEGHTRLILAIAREDFSNERLAVVEKAGFKAERVGISSEGVFTYFMLCARSSSEKAVILIDIDSNYTDFIVIHKQKLVYSKSIFIGANQLMHKRGEDWYEKFTEELKHFLNIYQAQGGERKISKVYLMGAGRGIKGLEQMLIPAFGFPVEIRETFGEFKEKISVDESVLTYLNSLEDYRFVSLSALIGFAFAQGRTEIDLTPRRIKLKRLMEKKTQKLLVMGVLLISLLMSLSFFLSERIYNKKLYLQQLRSQCRKTEKEAMYIERLKRRIKLIKERLNAKGSALDILYHIYSLTPKQIYFTDISIDEKKQVVLRGRAEVMSDVFRFVTTLEESPVFEGVKVTYATKKKEEKEAEVVFEIICLLEREEK